MIGSLNLLELADKNKAKILQASTSEVYGDPLEHPQNENIEMLILLVSDHVTMKAKMCRISLHGFS